MKGLTRRRFLQASGKTAAALAGSLPVFAGCRSMSESASRATVPPNVVLILTDDQAYGDLGCHGNDVIQTPNLDRLHGESVRFEQFYVSPVCSPTRSSLMTGRYNYRTGVVDTYLGRSMMHADEVTLAEILAGNGYRTGIFGKWHLGDNYPMRAMDQGFQESLVHNGGGIGQPSDPPGNSYFDPILTHNGEQKQYKGYCTDIFTDAAMAFIEANKEQPFFTYLSTNCPHSPLQIGEEYYKPYLDAGLDEKTARVYGMITNIDENVGRLLAHLQALGLEQNTLVIFLTDNGPCGSQGPARYNAGLRARKGTVYEGGIHVPCFMRWPGQLSGGRAIDRIAAHIDLVPTIAEACGAPLPGGLHVDGMSLMPLLRGNKIRMPGRTLYFQWHRGDAPELYRSCAARTQQYKLVDGKELYDLEADPGEEHDIAAEHADVVAEMRAGYEAWFADVGSTHGYEAPPIYVGTPHENPVVLTRQDWRGADGWGDKDLGHWCVDVRAQGRYTVELAFSPDVGAKTACFRFGDAESSGPVAPGNGQCTLEGIELSAGPGHIEAWLETGGGRVGARYVTITRND